MGSGPTTTSGGTTTQMTQPWEPAQPLLKGNLNAAGGLQDAGIGGQVYTGSTAVPFSNQSIMGMNQIENIAQTYGNAMQAPLQSYTGVMQTLDPIARGDFSQDTTFNRNLGMAQEAARDAVNSSASQMGRYGSGAHQQTLANSIGDVTNRAMLDRQNMALGQLNNYGNSMGGAFQTAMAPAQAMQGVGGMYEQLYGNVLNDKTRIFDAQQNKPWELIGRSNAIAQGAGSMGGTQTGNSQTISSQSASPSQWAGFGLSALGGMFPGGII